MIKVLRKEPPMLWPPCRLDVISVPAAPNTLGEEVGGGGGEGRERTDGEREREAQK